MANNIIEAVKARRSIYTLEKKSPLSDDKIETLIKDALKYVPSAFNSQSARVVLLLGNSHDELWENLKGIMKGMIPDKEAFEATAGKLDGFKAAYGTVLFFEDQKIVQGLQEQFALYKDNFPIWSNQSSGMLQFVVWSALAQEGYGASLQHYSPLVDEWVYKTTGVPKEWKLLGQMPFGKPSAPAGEKQFGSLDERFKVVK